MQKKTPLYDCHIAAGGKMVEFAGYTLPVEYTTGLIKEHNAVREACGLFDVSHMGEFELSGPGALASLNHLLTNNYDSLAVGKCRYSTMCYEDGGVVDDLIVYRRSEAGYFIIVNAANKEKDFAWMSDHLVGDTDIRDASDEYALMALQGPLAKEILPQVCDESLLPQAYFSFTYPIEVAGVTCLVSRTGYTGSFGYELYCASEEAPALWDALLEAGEQAGLIPCGLGARDTLRLEASMPLYGHEMNECIDPLEAGLSFCVKLDKPEFIGRDALIAKGTPKRKRVGLEVLGRGIVREQAPVFVEGQQIGETTSGTYCPALKKSCAMALVDAEGCQLGDTVEAEVRGRRIECKVVAMPFYTNKG